MQPSSVELRHGYQAGNFSILGSTLITGAVKWVNGAQLGFGRIGAQASNHN